MKNKLILLALTASIIFLFSSHVKAQWVQGQGPYGGSALCFASDSTTLFAGFANISAVGSTGSVYRSTDNGTTWLAPVSGLPNLGITTLLASGNTLFAATEYDDSYTGKWGLYRSIDHGLTWTHADTGIEASYILTCVELGGKVFAATDYGLYYSTNNGTSWQVDTALVKKGTQVPSITRIGTSLFAGGGDLVRSDDTGKSWFVAAAKYGSLSHLLVSGTDLLATGNDYNTDSSELFVSSDMGVTWAVKSKMKSYIRGLVQHGTDLFAGALSGAFRSTDQGKTWTELDTDLFRTKINDILVNNASLFIGTERGVYRSMDDGTTWTLVNTGMAVQKINALAVDGAYLFVGTPAVMEDNTNGYYAPGRIFQSSDNGATMTEIDQDRTYSLLGLDVTALTVSGSNLFATLRDQLGDWYANVRSIDRGATWIPAGTGLPNDYVQRLFANGADLFAGTINSGVYHSTDNGANWQAANTGLTTLNVNVISANGTTLFAGTNGGGIFRSNNNGASWAEINNGLSNFNVYAIAEKGSNVFAGTSGGGVFRSIDSGNNWMPVNTGLTKLSITSFAANGNNLFVGTGPRGVFRSTDDGTTWSEISTGLVGMNYLLIAATTTDLVAASDVGVWRRPLSDFASSGVAQTSPTTFELSPNPTSGMIRVHSAPTESHVTVLNMLGQRVLEVTNPRSPDFTIDLSHLQPGVYYVLLVSSNANMTKMIVRE